MKARFYRAKEKEAIIQALVNLGSGEVLISIGDNKLDWKEIKLNKEQTNALREFLNETTTI